MAFIRALRIAPKLGAAAALFSLLSIGSVNAATLSLLPGGTLGALPGTFDPSNITNINLDGVNVGTPIQIFGNGDGGGLSLSANATLRFDFMGKEASFVDSLLVNATAQYTNTAPIGTSFTTNIPSGLVPMGFQNPSAQSAINGGPISVGTHIAFTTNAVCGGHCWYAFFDDGGNGADADFDDMVVRISIVPLPATLPLFASGLGALGLLGWRKKRKTAALAAA
jgi:hypothetical protein